MHVGYIFKIDLNRLPVFIDDHEDLLRFSHRVNQGLSQIINNFWINLSMHVRQRSLVRSKVLIHKVKAYNGLLALAKHLAFCFLQDVHGEEVPKVNTNFENLIFWNTRALDKEYKSSESELFEIFDVGVICHWVRAYFDQSQILSQNRAYSQANLLAEVFEVRLSFGADNLFELLPNVSVLGYVYDLVDENAEK